MKEFGIIGYPLKHTLSPALMNCFFHSARIEAQYRSFAVTSRSIPKLLQEMGASGFVGANVTIPHKERIMDYLDDVDPEARAVGAVNTIRWRDGKSIGFNTDVYGFRRALEVNRTRINRLPAIILGAGGAARAVAYSLLDAESPLIYVAARNAKRRKHLVSDFRKKFAGSQIEEITWNRKALAGALSSVRLIVNATLVGMSGARHGSELPVAWGEVTSSHIAYDLVYDPPLTEFLQRAQEQECSVINGLPMLMYQAARSLTIWLDRDVEHRAILLWRRLLRSQSGSLKAC